MMSWPKVALLVWVIPNATVSPATTAAGLAMVKPVVKVLTAPKATEAAKLVATPFLYKVTVIVLGPIKLAVYPLTYMDLNVQAAGIGVACKL